jgi:hypothetical protein
MTTGALSIPDPALAGPLAIDSQVDEPWRAVEDVSHHRPGGLQPFLAARIPGEARYRAAR